MFRIGIMEMALTCLIAALTLVIPAAFVWLYRRMDQRIKDLENKLEKRTKE